MIVIVLQGDTPCPVVKVVGHEFESVHRIRQTTVKHNKQNICLKIRYRYYITFKEHGIIAKKIKRIKIRCYRKY